MGLRQYAALVRKWLWLLIVVTLLAAGVAYAVSRNTTPVYEASVTLMVNQASNPATVNGYSDILSSERLARTYASLLTSWPVLDETAQRLGIPTEGLDRRVTVTPVRDTQLLGIKVEGTNPSLIVRIANTLPQVFIERNQEMLLGRVSQSRANLEREIASTEGDLARTQEALKSATTDAEKTRLETSLAQYRSTYSNLVASYQQVRVTETQAFNNIVVAEPATEPDRPVRPRTVANVFLSAVVGLLLALGIAFLVEYLDDSVKSPDDIDRVTGLSTLGAISRLKESGDTRLAAIRSRAPEAEAYRTLRTNIQFSSVDRPIRSMLVTSSGPGEGKSTTTANLAGVMAQTGQRVIVVDTDLRRPVLHRTFGIANNLGLTTALLAGDDASPEVYLQATELPNLQVMTSGPIPPNPSELLGSHRMMALVEKLAGLADLVIFDSPPVLAVTDAAVLGRQVDGVILVVDTARTREGALSAAVEDLRKTGANLLGVVLNRMEAGRGSYYYYYYYYADSEGTPSHQGRDAAPRNRRPWFRKPA